MAWTDQCKLHFKSNAKTLVSIQQGRKNVTAVIKKIGKDSGIPFNTLKRWYYEDEENSIKNDPTQETNGNDSKNEQKSSPKTPETPEKRPICKKCKKSGVALRSRSKKPYGPNSRYYGLCDNCRKKAEAKNDLNVESEVAPTDGTVTGPDQRKEKNAPQIVTETDHFVEIAKIQLSRIKKDDPKRKEKLLELIEWIQQEISTHKKPTKRQQDLQTEFWKDDVIAKRAAIHVKNSKVVRQMRVGDNLSTVERIIFIGNKLFGVRVDVKRLKGRPKKGF